ncbi:hypothetical protein, partial [Enterobacter hormaechei]|uniref:hypothetical protein n=1 Tax=Enterobacter hormaechei TaxID=158836 RepID=UPI001954A6D1
FERNGLWISLVTALSVAVFIIAFIAWQDSAVLFGVDTRPGAFYRLLPHNTMVAIFGGAFLFAIVAMTMGL